MKSSKTNTPRIIIHGGAGNISRANLTEDAYQEYRSALLATLHSSYALLSKPGATALDVATRAVAMLEDNPLFNAGHGAVYTTAGTHELEASVMVSKGYHKRGVGVMEVSGAKNPIKLARELLVVAQLPAVLLHVDRVRLAVDVAGEILGRPADLEQRLLEPHE